MRHQYVFIVAVYLISVSTVRCQNNNEGPVEKNLTDDRTSLIWTTTDPASIVVKADAGYQIQVKAKEFNVNGSNEDYVTVKSVTDDGDESDALMFTYAVSGKPIYLYNNNKIQADYVGTSPNNTFLIEFTRVGEPLTTTPEPVSTTTTEAMPTPSPDEQNDAALTVYLQGRPMAEFDESLQKNFKKSIADMGVKYCQIQNCPLNESITYNNVKIRLLSSCSLQWVNYETCVELSFALPIVKSDSPFDQLWDGYQLNQGHLKLMWDTYAKQYLDKMDLDVYTVPNVDKMFNNRLLISCLIIVTLIVFILIVRHLMGRIHKTRRRLSDTVSIVSQQSKRNSQLTPHYLQELPPLFSSDFPIYAEQRSHKTYSDFNVFSDDFEPNIPPSSPNTLKIAVHNDQEDSEVEA